MWRYHFDKVGLGTISELGRFPCYDLVKRLGADAIFDYIDVDCGQKIREHTSNTLMYALDCISEGPSAKICDVLKISGLE